MRRRASSYPESLTLWIHSVLRIEKKFSAKALSYGLPRLDIDGVMPYDCVIIRKLCAQKGVEIIEAEACPDHIHKTVSATLGHSQVTTTLNIYAHSFQEAQARASETIANALPFKKDSAKQA